MKKAMLFVFILGTMIFASGAVLAAMPNHQACIGKDISGYAQDGAGFGSFFSTLASNTQGIGDEVQAHQAGLVPDSVIPNSCND